MTGKTSCTEGAEPSSSMHWASSRCGRSVRPQAGGGLIEPSNCSHSRCLWPWEGVFQQAVMGGVFYPAPSQLLSLIPLLA